MTWDFLCLKCLKKCKNLTKNIDFQGIIMYNNVYVDRKQKYKGDVLYEENKNYM